jgi:hypothetical protein
MHLYNYCHKTTLTFNINESYPTHDTILSYLNNYFKNTALDEVFILKVTNVNKFSKPYIRKYDADLHVQFSVEFESECISFMLDELITATVKIIRDDIVIASHMGALISVYRTAAFASISVDDIIPLRITRVMYDYKQIVLTAEYLTMLPLFTKSYQLISQPSETLILTHFPLPKLLKEKISIVDLFRPDAIKKASVSFTLKTTDVDVYDKLNTIILREEADGQPHKLKFDIGKPITAVNLSDTDVSFSTDIIDKTTEIALDGNDALERLFMEIAQTIIFINNLILSEKLLHIYKNGTFQ